MARTVFAPEELQLIGEATRVARDLTGQRFALPLDWFEDTSHQVCSGRDLRRGEVLGPGRLAMIRRVTRLRAGESKNVLHCRQLCRHYRICLQDHNLLRRARQSPCVDLESLLTCVLTHEFVHLVRFHHRQHPYQASAEDQALEERRVEEISAGIIGKHGHRSLRRAAELLAPTAMVESRRECV